MRDLPARWDAWYNGGMGLDPTLGYILLSAERLLIAWAAWLMLRALIAYLAVVFPPPYTPANIAHWLRWWLWLRLNEFPALKLGTVAVAVLLVLQIPAGVAGSLNTLTPYLFGIYPGLLALLIGVTQLLRHLTYRATHPQ